MRRSLAVALVVLGLYARDTALGQRLRFRVVVAPSSPTTLGQHVTIGVRPALSGTTYRYVAAMSVTGSSMLATGTSCAAAQTIGSGLEVSWLPASGAYRLTVIATRPLTARDSTTVTYQVDAPHSGFLNVSATQYPPVQPGRVTLSLRTNDRGPGHRYQWVVRFAPAAGANPVLPVYWTGDTPIPLYTVPFVVQPGTYNITARVGVYTADPCRISEVSVGGLTGQVIH